MLNNRYALTVALDDSIEENTLYEGYDTAKGIFVWVKFIKPTRTMSKTFISDYIDERTMLDSLEASFMLRVLDVGYTVVGTTEYMYIVSEYSKGLLLSEILKGNYLHIDGLISIAVQLVKCLDRLHIDGIYHGGLNPSNILVTKNYEVKLLEVGLTRANDGKHIRNNYAKYYLSPAQLNINYTDVTSDYFTLGTILFEAIFNKLPYDVSDDEAEFLRNVDRGVAWCDLTSYVVKYNTKLVDIVKRLLSRSGKYSSTAEIIVDLSEVLYANANIVED